MFSCIARKENLDDIELHILLLLIYSEFGRRDTLSHKAVLNIISRNEKEYLTNKRYLLPGSKLIEKEIISVSAHKVLGTKMTLLYLHEKFISKIRGNTNPAHNK